MPIYFLTTSTIPIMIKHYIIYTVYTNHSHTNLYQITLNLFVSIDTET